MKRWLVFILLGVLLCGCSKEETVEKLVLPYDEYKQTYHIIEKLEDDTSNYTDVLYYKNQILATDSKNNCIKVWNEKFEDVQVIGSMGNGQLQFIKPKAMDVDQNGMIYILDYGNSRIQVLDSNLQYKKEIALSFLEGSDYQTETADFVVSEDGTYAYITGTLYNPNLIYVNLETGETEQVVEYTEGYVTKINQTIYYIELGECIVDGDDMTITSGVNYLYTLKSKEIISKVRLSDDLTVRGIMAHNEQLLCSSWRVRVGTKSSGGSLIHQFKTNGDYVETIFGTELIDDQFENNKKPENEALFLYYITEGPNDSILAIYSRKGQDDSKDGMGIMVLDQK